MRLRYALATVVLLLALIPTASAASLSDFRRAQVVAAGHFPTACPPILRWRDISERDAITWRNGRPECSITFNARSWRWRWRKICRVMVHEYGHLAGLDHSDDFRSVMYPTAPAPRACRR